MQRTSTASWERPTWVSSLPPRRVLRIEDDAFVAELVTATLGDAGIEVRWISSGRPAITVACACESEARLICIDTRDMSPLAAAAELARLDGGVPIILIADDPQKRPPSRNLTVVRNHRGPPASRRGRSSLGCLVGGCLTLQSRDAGSEG